MNACPYPHLFTPLTIKKTTFRLSLIHISEPTRRS